MPAKINMFLSNGNHFPQKSRLQINTANLDTISRSIPAPATSLNAPIITRIHGTPSGCGSCGKRRG
jgi:hypothetical protein